MERYDFVVLGGGNAGLTAAKRVQAAGKRVALVDPTPIGGLCALRGCNPKKVLVRAVEVLHAVREASGHGIRTGDVSIDWNAVIDRKHRFTDPVPEQTADSLRAAGVDYVNAAARFVAPDTLRIDERTVQFEHALIATGSAPRRLEFPGAEHASTSDDILELRTVPRRLAIIGGGVVAFEFAHVFARLGSAVHILMRGRTPLGRSDADLAARLVEHLETLGLELHRDAEVERIERGPRGFDVRLEGGGSVGADFVLNAAGRPPQLDGLGLDAAQVEHSAKGVKVDAHLRSVSNRRIFAGGDAHGRMKLSPVASYEGRIVAENVLHGERARADYDSIPSVVYTVPPLAGVGLTEDEARSKGLDIEVAFEAMSDWTVYRIAGEKPAHGKVIADRHTGRILGAHLFGPGADELINLYAMAMRFGISTRQLAEMIWAYPTFASALGHLKPGA